MTLSACFGSVVVAVALGAQDSQSAPDASTSWLAENAVRVRSWNPAEGDLSDLAPLKTLVGDARVVMLGEQAHAEGETFLGKTRLIRYLHEEMGFDVLCFESGLYDCERAWQSLKAGEDAWSAMSTAVFPIWMKAEELRPLSEYLGREAKGARPLELCGYDCQLTGSQSRDHLLAEITALNAKASPPPLDAEGLERIGALIAAFKSGKAPPADDRTAIEAALTTLRDALTPERFPTVPERDRAFWRQMIASMPALLTMLANAGRTDILLPEMFNPRDEQGGETMVWLARERYAGRKIIVWAASMHCVRHPETITSGLPGLSYEGVRTMGTVAADALGEQVFVLSFTSGAGTAGNAFGKSWPVPEPPTDSLEARLARASLGPAIVPLRGAPAGSFAAGTFVARPLGNAPMTATWSRHVDAFAFTPVMRPATARSAPKAAEGPRELIPALEQAAREIAARTDDYRDKAGFASVWSEWMESAKPTEAERDAAASQVEAWAAKRHDDPSLGWRALALESRVAADRSDVGKAMELLDRAMAAYPTHRHGDPIRHSVYHHLANERAMLLRRAAGDDAAIAWIVDHLASDAKMRAFYPAAWSEALGRGPKLDALRRDALAVLAQRLAHIPEDKEITEQVIEATKAQLQ